MKCGCKIKDRKQPGRFKEREYYIEHCPLCKAAPELLKALQYVERTVKENGIQDYFDNQVITAIQKAEA